MIRMPQGTQHQAAAVAATQSHSSALTNPALDIIVPSAAGERHLPKLLESLHAQTADPEQFAVIVVVNGESGISDAHLQAYRERFPRLTLRWAFADVPSASRARNVGLALSTANAVTFVDDDDTLEPAFVEVGIAALANLPNNDTIVCMPMHNLNESGRRIDNDAVEERIASSAGLTEDIARVSWVLGFNACKIIPRHCIEGLRYPEHLRSGEDVCFFAQLLGKEMLQVHFPKIRRDAAYLRWHRKASISRQLESFSFNVEQRLACIRELLLTPVAERYQQALGQLVRSQHGFIERYLGKHPHELARLQEVLPQYTPFAVNWKELPPRKAERLVISYCFPPFADPSGNVVAKRIAKAQKNCRVISANMSQVRNVDASLQALVDPWVVEHKVLQVPQSFANWAAITSFAEQTLAVTGFQGKPIGWSLKRSLSTSTWNGLRARLRNQPVASSKLVAQGIEELYSRAHWPASHVAAFAVHQANPGLRWIAEFSDPMRIDAEGRQRVASLGRNATKDPLALQMLDAINASGMGYPFRIDDINVFELIEATTFAMADELVFTNPIQREVMLECYSQPWQQLVMEKSVIQPQPTLPEFWYSMSWKPGMDAPQYPLKNGTRIRVGYFGNVLANRNLDTLMRLLEEPANTEAEFPVELHVFGNAQLDLENQALVHSQRHVFAHEALDFVSFLQAMKDFDVLLVNDTVVPLEKNPFLPSKVSDYLGSGVPIWAVVEEGSPLSSLATRFQSRGDEEDLRRVLAQIRSEIEI